MATSVESAGIDGITTTTIIIIIIIIATARGKKERDRYPHLCLKDTSVTTVDASSERSKN
jgi:hypothetical protein